MQDRWNACASRLEAEVSEQLYKTWLKPLVCLGHEATNGVLRLGLPNQFKLNWVRSQYGTRIGQLAIEVFGPGTHVAFELIAAPESPRETPSRPVNPPRPALAEAGSNTPEPSADAAPVLVPLANDRTRLRPDLAFDNFVTGKANQMARAAALQVVERPATYNPLFLYGGVGLGKTHLMHAVGNAFMERSANARVRYIHAQEYFDEMVRAIQRKTSEDLKQYYQSLDLLLIDDIQFLSGKPRTQEEFFYTFDALYAARRQIIITCDTYPKEIAGLEERLISRFDSGLIVAIEPPELEMRVAILLKKAEQQGAALPEDVAFFIAKHLRSNVRELEGALLRVVAYAGFRERPVSLELAKEALEDLLALNRRQISVEFIQKTVADFYKTKVAEMYGKRRHAHIVLPRQVAMYLAKELTQKSLPEIGEAFGGRDHTTVLHAVRKIAEQRQHDTDLNHQIHVLEQTLRG
ncbi:MAG: chromosomal replication initiator protein DnaA [Burkholderiales bacterium]